MKKPTKKILLLLAAGYALTTSAQTLLQEDFTSGVFFPYSMFNPVVNGWHTINLTGLPGGTPGQTWFQANPPAFPAYNGNVSDFYACNWASSTNTSSAETISNWLISPTITLVNGGVLEFATRIKTNPAAFPDRMEVYYSTGTGLNVGTTATSVGTFSNLIAVVNPSLTPTGYPDVWTIYINTLTGLSGPTAGRIAFRYFVTNGGPATSATNADYIGLDGVRYYIPCGVSVQSYTICPGLSATLSAYDAHPQTTYTWLPGGSNSASIVVSPSSTSIYTLTYNEAGSGCPDKTATVTIGNFLSTSIGASGDTVCSGSTVTLTAHSAAATYSWSTGAATPSVVVTPTAASNYFVLTNVGTPPNNCPGVGNINLKIFPLPVINYTLTPSVICTGKSLTLSASGAKDHFWLASPTVGSPNNPLISTATASGVAQFTLEGVDAMGCISTLPFSFTIYQSPTVAVSSSTTQACTNSSISLTASGAGSYTWTGAASSTINPLSFTTGSVAGTEVFTLTGISQDGCTATSSFSQSVVLCNVSTVGLDNLNGHQETEIFPNPFSSEIKVNVLEGHVIIYNALGQAVLNAPVNYSETITTINLSKGVYVVKAYNTRGEEVRSLKLIKN